MAKENYLPQLHAFLEEKGLTEEEVKLYLTEVFKKAFEKDKDALSRYEEEEPLPAKVEVEIDLEEAGVSIKKFYDVVEEKTIIARFTQIELGDERLEGTDLKIGDTFEETISLDDVNIGKTQHIKQLFLQKLSEIEKIKLYNKFSKHRNELLTPVIHKTLNKGHLILDYNGDSIFMPATEISPLDRDRIEIGKPLLIFVLDIEELSKDAQIIASRKHPQFVAKLIERDIDDVADGIVTIEEVSREAGFKTKVAVSTTDPNVDPVGSIIGVKGQKIKPIVDEIGGERLDIIKYHEDPKQFIAEALLPAEITGIKVDTDEEGWNTATVVVEEEQFLPALGKRGLNIKLAAILTKHKIDVKTIAEAKEEGIEWEPITKSKYVSPSTNIGIDLDEFSNITEEMALDIDDNEISESDYDFGEDFEISEPKEMTEEEFYNPEDYEEEEF